MPMQIYTTRLTNLEYGKKNIYRVWSATPSERHPISYSSVTMFFKIAHITNPQNYKQRERFDYCTKES
jgi:hypothetical protein